MAAKDAKVPTLNDLSRHKFEDLEAFFKEIGGESERACALVLAAVLDHDLVELIRTKFPDEAKSFDELLFFGDKAPMGTLHSRTIVALAFGFIGEAQRKDIDRIRRIRNAFAHASKTVSFETPAIAKECNALKNFKSPNPDGVIVSTSRQKYIETAHTLHFYLADQYMDYCDQLNLALRMKTDELERKIAAMAKPR
jgi:DNA-binding MltR family transcriptional regulator